jgi:hypothetical protein
MRRSQCSRLHRLTTTAIAVAATAGAVLAVSAGSAAAAQPGGKLDGVVVSVADSTWTLSGWAVDYQTPTTAIQVDVYLDGAFVTATTAGLVRSDIPNSTGTGLNHGFSVPIAAPTAAGTHYACAYAINSVASSSNNPLLGCRKLTVAATSTSSTTTTTGTTTTAVVTTKPFGKLDTLTGDATAGTWTVSGYAVQDSSPTTALQVDVYLDGTFLTATTANLARTDVGLSTARGVNHGFSVTITKPTDAGKHYVCAYALNTDSAGTNTLLGCRGVTVSA